MSSFMPLTETQSMIFDITKLHQKYWRTFCDVYYVHLGFETEEVHSYEQKYETFCRRKSVMKLSVVARVFPKKKIMKKNSCM